jgi:hypothetical protein
MGDGALLVQSFFKVSFKNNKIEIDPTALKFTALKCL